MTLRSDGTMYCPGCDEFRPRSYFRKTTIVRASHHVRCESCRELLPKKKVTSKPVEPSHRVAFIVGYGPQLFGDVKLDNVKPVDRERAFWAGEMYNANAR